MAPDGTDDFEMRPDEETLCFPAGMKNPPISIVYVPSHLYHMLFELFKVREKPSHVNDSVGPAGVSSPPFLNLQNAMRATIETHENSDHLPPVHVLVSLGDEDVSIKVRTDRLLFRVAVVFSRKLWIFAAFTHSKQLVYRPESVSH